MALFVSVAVDLVSQESTERESFEKKKLMGMAEQWHGEQSCWVQN